MPADQPAQKHVVAPRVGARQLDEPLMVAGNLHHRHVFQRLAILGQLQLDDQVQRFVEQLGKRMRGINRQRREHGAQLRAVKIFQPVQVRLLQVGKVQEADAVLGKRRFEFVLPAAVLADHHAADALRHGLENLGGRAAVHRALGRVAFDLLLEAGDAHLEKLVEVRAADAEEFQAFEQGIRRIQRLVEDALVEFQPAQLAVEEMFRFENRVRHKMGETARHVAAAITSGKVTIR